MSINPWAEELFTGFYNVNDPAIAAEVVAERLADDFVDHSPVFGASADKAGFSRTVSYINATFRQNYVVERLVEQGDIVVAIWSAESEHVGQFLHVPASGKRFTVHGITAYSLRGGKVTAHWEQFGVLTILTELGIVPPLNG